MKITYFSILLTVGKLQPLRTVAGINGCGRGVASTAPTAVFFGGGGEAWLLRR